MVTGQVGVGRSSVLAAVRERLAAQRLTIVDLQVAHNERNRPYAVASRLTGELRAMSGERPGPAGLSTTGEPHSAVASLLSAALAKATNRRLVVLVDDAQWIDPGSLSIMVPLVRVVSRGAITIVCTFRPTADADAGQSALNELRTDGLAEVVWLRPLLESDVAALLTDVLRARPSAQLCAHLRRTCQGLPGLVLAAIDGHRRTGALWVENGQACLTRPDQPPASPAELPLFQHFRRLGEQTWSVVKALAVLCPLGDSTVRLIAAATGISEPQVLAALHTLRAEGVLLTGPKPGHWWFRPPVLPAMLLSCLGPYERRRLAQIAVTELRHGSAVAPDGRYLPEQLANAGKLVDDPVGAADELLTSSVGILFENGYFAERWARAAADLVTDPPLRARALLQHIVTCHLHRLHAEAADHTRLLLAEYATLLPPEAALALDIVHVCALAGTMDAQSLTDIANEGWQSLPGNDGDRIVARAVALCQLDRWPEADELLRSTQDVWRAESFAAGEPGALISLTIALLRGRPEELNRMVADSATSPRAPRPEHILHLSRVLAWLGELDDSNRLLSAHNVPMAYQGPPDRAIRAALSGHWHEALELTTVSRAHGHALAEPATHAVMCKLSSAILIERGRLAQARTMIDHGRADKPVLGVLLAGQESRLHDLLGATDLARQVLVDALARAGENRVVLGTDELWLGLAAYDVGAGNLASAQRCVVGSADVAERLGTRRSRLLHLLTRALVNRDTASATEAIELARKRDQPYELAFTLKLLAGNELADRELLLEAYELYGALGALLTRARLRRVMRRRDIKVPGRDVTAAENERLLACLVTEGLTNRALAAVLCCSDKSVEGRLTRLFQRTGYRSRVELATAMLSHRYP